MAGGLKAFQLEKPSSIDIKCKKCIENYQNTFETNTKLYDECRIFFKHINLLYLLFYLFVYCSTKYFAHTTPKL